MMRIWRFLCMMGLRILILRVLEYVFFFVVIEFIAKAAHMTINLVID